MKERTQSTILVGLDISRASRSAFKQALVLASSMRARLVAVAVTPKYEGNMSRLKMADANAQLSEPFRNSLEDAASYAESLGLKTDTVHRIGEPSEEIIAVAEEEGAGIVLLGSSKRSQVERVLLGRTIVKVISGGSSDVLLIPENAEINFGKILVGVSGSEHSMEAGRRALDLAQSYSSEVHAVHAIDVPVDRSLLYGVLDDARHRGFKALEKFVALGEAAGISIFTELRETTPEKGVVSYAVEKDIHLIVLGTRGGSVLSEMMWGSVVERVVSLTSCPVLVVKKYNGAGI